MSLPLPPPPRLAFAHAPALVAARPRRASVVPRHAAAGRPRLYAAAPRMQLARAVGRDGPDALRDVPEPVLRAVERLARQERVTVADVAAGSGVEMAVAQDGLVELAGLTGAAIDVSDAGELSYRFPRNVRQVLRQRSLRSKLRMAWEKAWPLVFSAIRVSFGVFLVASIVITFLAIVAISQSGRGEDDRRERGGGGGGSMLFGPRLFGPNIFDVMFYSSRMGGGGYYYEQQDWRGRGRSPVREKREMSFLESVYSFVFGDGDPNANKLDRRWRKVAAVIRSNNGCIAAEQVAPFLDLPAGYVPDRRETNVDESFMLPVLQRFHGHPEVTDDGDLVYVFPDFGVTGSTTGGAGAMDVVGTASTDALRETELTLSSASSSQKLVAGALGVLNLGGVLTLGSMLATAVPATADSAALLSLVSKIFPALLAYALTFVVVPLLRLAWQRVKNREIRARNQGRARAGMALARPSPELRSKLAAAGSMQVGSRVLSGDDVLFSSDRDATDQPGLQREATSDFDRRLREKDGRA